MMVLQSKLEFDGGHGVSGEPRFMRRSRRDHSDEVDVADDVVVGAWDKSPRCHIVRIASVKRMLFRTTRGRPTNIVTEIQNGEDARRRSFHPSNIPSEETTARKKKKKKREGCLRDGLLLRVVETMGETCSDFELYVVSSLQWRIGKAGIKHEGFNELRCGISRRVLIKRIVSLKMCLGSLNIRSAWLFPAVQSLSPSSLLFCFKRWRASH